MKKLTALLMSFLLCMPLMAAPNDFVSSASEGGNSGENGKPCVLPALRNWTPAEGRFPVEGSTLICDESGTGAGEKAAEFFRELCGKDLTVTQSPSGSGEIRLVRVKKLPSSVQNREEGYLLDITPESAVVSAETYTGLLYGAVSLAQMCYGDGQCGFIPCGSAEDYPAFGVRKGLIDVARTWVPLNQLKQIAKYMAWFKMNEIHVHLTDNQGFRIESDIPGLSTVVSGEKRYYGKDEYRDFQKEVLEYGIRVVNEIDTPAHSGPFANIASGGPAMVQGRFLDISDAEFDNTVSFVKSVWDEYLKGDDPVFVGKVVSIGTDEYLHDADNTWNEPMRRFTAEIGTYVHDLGYIPCNWAFFGPNGFPGETVIPSFIRADMWDNGISGLEKIVEGKYDMVNMLNARLYVVPGENSPTGFPERMNIRNLYDTWQVWDFSGWGISKSVPKDDPHLLGAGFALWNDYGGQNLGMTVQDIFDRLRDMTCLVAEKTWAGEDTEDGDVEEFLGRVSKLGRRAGSADPGFHALEKPVTVDFSKELPEGFSANGKIEDGKLILDGESFLSFDRKAVGFPNTLTMTFRLDALPDEPLMRGGGFELRVNADGRKHVGFLTEDYKFIFDCVLPIGEEVTIQISSGISSTTLLVNGKCGYNAYNMKNRENNRMETFVVPLETVGKGAVGYIRSITVSPEETDITELRLDGNVALNKPVTVSGTEVPDRLLAENAVDGSEASRLSFDRSRDEQWLTVDLGKVMPVQRVEIQFYERVLSYDVFVSEDGKDYKKVYGFDGSGEDAAATEGKPYLDEIRLKEPVSGRYVKYVQNKRWYHKSWSTYYSGGIIEFRVFRFDKSVYENLALNARANASKRGPSDPIRRKLTRAAVELDDYLKTEGIYEGNLAILTDRIADLTNGALTVGKRAGDLNGDGRVSAADFRMLKGSLNGSVQLSDAQSAAADVTGDGKAGPEDAGRIRDSALKKDQLL